MTTETKFNRTIHILCYSTYRDQNLKSFCKMISDMKEVQTSRAVGSYIHAGENEYNDNGVPIDQPPHRSAKDLSYQRRTGADNLKVTVLHLPGYLFCTVPDIAFTTG
uniref:Uncharacterized protein n=2 Tax=Arundo donax TaxID=35708 RepID=A0A0A9RX37_ARUDO